MNIILLTRRQIIKIWLEGNEKFLDYHCCPYCRNLLVKTKDENYFCNNDRCDNNNTYENPELKENENGKN
ncbi:hypothetical protein LCGC14_0794360 [marine sediment metagenome]|uniref:Uncharacterized protein n=1 Tax=marine sediment metagenome TaxID=412755 RepID=A0A0F9PVZ2_9ZZZZ